MIGLVAVIVASLGATSYFAYRQHTTLSDVEHAHNFEKEKLYQEITQLTEKLKRFEYINDEELYSVCRERVVENDSKRFAENSVATVKDNVTTYETDPETFRELKRLYDEELADCERRFKARS